VASHQWKTKKHKNNHDGTKGEKHEKEIVVSDS